MQLSKSLDLVQLTFDPRDGGTDLRTTVGEVRDGQDQGAIADQVANVADDARLVGRKFGNAAVVLLIAGVSIGDDSLDLVFHGLGEAGDGAMHDSCALAVCSGLSTFHSHFYSRAIGFGCLAALPITATHDLGVRAFGVSQVEQLLRFIDGFLSCAFGEQVASDTRLIARSNSLAGNSSSELAVDLVAGLRTDGFSLIQISIFSEMTQECLYLP